MRKCDELSRVLRIIGDEYGEEGHANGVTVADKDDSLSLKLSVEDIEAKITDVEDELGGPCRFTGKICTDHGGHEVAGTALRALSLARR